MNTIQKQISNLIIEQFEVENKKSNLPVYSNIVILGNSNITTIFLRYSKLEISSDGGGGREQRYVAITQDGKLDYNPMQISNFESIEQKQLLIKNLKEITQ